MHPGTYYAASAGPGPVRPVLRARVDAQVCVVGAGFAGLATAIGLIERGVRDVVIVEGQNVGHGASGRNGGFVFAGFCGDPAVEAEIKARTKATIRCLPDAEFRSPEAPTTCIWTGRPATVEAVWARAY